MRPTIQFMHKSGTDHDVAIEDANGNVIVGGSAR
jgi:hypothetical protein